MKSILDSRQLLAVSVLAKTGSFTSAGRELFLTQSAVSHAIKAMEDDLQCRLFERTGRGATPTLAGLQYLVFVEKILQQMEVARAMVAPPEARERGKLRIGVTQRARQWLLPAVLRSFEKEFPQHRLSLESGYYDTHLDLLGAGLLDLAFTLRPVNRPEFEFVPLFEDELCFIVAPSHPWAELGELNEKHFGGSELMLCARASKTPELVAEYFRLEGMAPGRFVEVASMQTIKDIVSTGLAAGIMPPWFVYDELASGTLVALPMGRHRLVRQCGISYLKQHRITLAEESLIAMCRSAVGPVLDQLRGLPSFSEERRAKPAG